MKKVTSNYDTGSTIQEIGIATGICVGSGVIAAGMITAVRAAYHIIQNNTYPVLKSPTPARE